MLSHRWLRIGNIKSRILLPTSPTTDVSDCIRSSQETQSIHDTFQKASAYIFGKWARENKCPLGVGERRFKDLLVLVTHKDRKISDAQMSSMS